MPGEEADGGLFSASYSNFEASVLARVRQETYGEDLGQFSWLTADELRRFADRLDLGPGSSVLDVACGSGGPALFLAGIVGCQVTGVDINGSGIRSAGRMAEARDLVGRARFRVHDAARPLPFDDASFDAVICIDAVNHLLNRHEVMREWHRVLQPGGCVLFTDAVVVTGPLTRGEILARSTAMGQFVFTPSGAHEQVIEAAGFEPPDVVDVTDTIEGVAKRWHAARREHQTDLAGIEGQEAWDDMQRMLATAHRLSAERRLSRFAYLARKPDRG